jgi:hypothetical protein
VSRRSNLISLMHFRPVRQSASWVRLRVSRVSRRGPIANGLGRDGDNHN